VKYVNYKVLLWLATSICVSAQSAKRTTPVGTGTISGHVFAITEGGDLKVARLAHVYLFYSGSLKGAEDNTAASTFTSALTSEMHYHDEAWKEHVAEMQQRYAGMDISSAIDSELCRSQLLSYAAALNDTLDWVEANKKLKQFQSTDSDEEGVFFTKIPAGIYQVVAQGQAGINEAYWASRIVVPPGRTVSVKLSSPEQSCIKEVKK